MKTEASMITETAPEGRTAKSKSSKKTAKPGSKSKPAAKTSTKPSGAKKAKAAEPKTKSERVTKSATVLELLRRKEGATIAAIAKATGWQNHSIRGFLSGTVTKKLGLEPQSEKNQAGERVYRIS